MYEELSEHERLHLAIDFHLKGSSIPKELSLLLGTILMDAIINPIVNKEPTHEDVWNNTNIRIS